MFKKHTRIVAFIGTLGASATLIGMAATNTGAYFQDSEGGSLSGKTGHLDIAANNDFNLNFNDLVPGVYQDRVIKYHTDSNTPEDIWLKIPDGVAYAQFSGAKNGQYDANGGLGRFGHFAVKNNAGNLLFSSYNLANLNDSTSGCADDNGHGSGPQATAQDDFPPNCGVPHYMLIDQNVPTGADRQFTITFGVTERKSAQYQAQPPQTVPFQVVATQPNIRPDAVGH
jgi:hypothetical protein